MSFTVGKLASIARVSIRALHYYDEMGLVRPSARSDAGYRLYTEQDLERLQQVLFYRALDFSLDQIRTILDAPEFDRRESLVHQRALLVVRADRARALVELVDKSITALDAKEEKMKAEEMFDGFDPADYAEEAMAKWGKTAAYAEHKKRASRYTKEDWKKMADESLVIVDGFVDAMTADVSPGDARAMDLAEQHREHLQRWFFSCSLEMHVGLGDMYVADPRFSAHYDRRKSGLASFISQAIHANAECRASDARAPRRNS
jgi:DNA-binding transcriptional MerR regulator